MWSRAAGATRCSSRRFSRAPSTPRQQIAQQQAEMANLSVAGQAAAQHEANEEYQRKLSARIEELQKREYRAPVKPLQCKEEREAALACYKSTKGKTPGEVYFACQQAADDLDKCAALVREAAMSKIVKGALTKAGLRAVREMRGCYYDVFIEFIGAGKRRRRRG